MSGFAPLSGVRVVDFSKILAGPLCTQYLADLGAEVIKVEAIGTGDDTRHWPPFENGVGTVFLSVNRNKGSLAIDLKSPAGREACRRLARCRMWRSRASARAWPSVSAWATRT